MIKSNRFQKLCLISIVFMSYTLGFSHEGHNQIPGSVNAPHGGWVQGTNELYVELVKEAEKIRFYVTDHSFNKTPQNKLELKALLKFPKNQKRQNEVLVLEMDSESYFFSPKSKNLASLHRYEVELDISFTHESKKTLKKKLSFQIENTR